MPEPAIPGWRLGPLLGEGRLGRVYRCEREGEAGDFAMKVVRVGDAGLRQRFSAEIRALSRLNHPNVCRMIDAGWVEDRAWVAMALAPGLTLLHWRRPPGLEPAVILGVVRQVASALTHAHGRGVHHRDVKPANVLVSHEGHATLVDFGVAILDGSSEASWGGRRPGTPAYAPPEWFAAGPVDPAAHDVYALAITAYELAIGASAYPDRGPEAWQRAKAAPLHLPDPRGPAALALDRWIQAATHPDPARRPSASATELQLDAWSALAPPETGTVADPGTEAPGTLSGPGQATIGRYRVLREIGRGNMGVVYLARDPELSRDVAIKRMFASSPAARQRFAREARSVARIDHPGVIRVLDYGEDEIGPYFAMAYVDGPDLASELARGLPPPDVALRWTIAVADALVAAHAAGVVHRDVKPGNVILEGGERPCLGDFGLAVVADETRLTRAEAVMGTPAYMAPEQMFGRTVDARADVYALGAMLYEMLVGRPPYEGVVPEVLLRGAQGRPSMLGVSAALARVVARALEGNPADRYPSMTAFLADLSRIRDGVEPEARAPTWATLAARAWRRPATRWATAAAAAGLAALGVPAFGWIRAEIATYDRERAAADHARAMEAAVGRAVAAGDLASADTAFLAFVDYPLHQGTRAEADAWIAQARRLAARPAPDPRSLAVAAAWAQAWATSITDDQRRLSLDGLAGALLDAGRLDALGALARMGDEAGSGRSWSRIHRLRDTYSRALPLPIAGGERDAARALLVGLKVEDAAYPVVLDVDQDGRAELFLGPDSAGAWRVRPGGGWSTPAEPSGWRGFCPLLTPWSIPGEGAFVLETCPHQQRVLAASRGALRPVHTVAAYPLTAWWFADLDRDGRAEVYAGADYPQRELIRLRRHDGAGWTEQRLSASTSAANSTVAAIASLDPQDPSALYVASAAYENYDVRRRAPTADGDLRVVARRQLGNVYHGAQVQGPAGRRWFAVLNTAGGPPAFTDESPDPLAEGLHLLDADLQVVSSWRASPFPCTQVWAADLDGDGTHEVLAQCQGALAVIDVGPQGELSPSWIGGVRPLSVGDGDGDGDDEVVVALEPGGGEPAQTWVLGVGTSPLPPWALPTPEAAPASLEPGFREVWSRAEDLAALGMPEEAERRFEALAVLDPDGPAGGLALARAADLARRRGEPAVAAERYERAGGRPGAEADLWRNAADMWSYQLDFERAEAALDAWRARGGRGADPRDTWKEAATSPYWEPDLRRPFDPAWHVARPADLAIRPDRGGVRVRATGAAEIARLPLEQVGPVLGLEVAWELRHVEVGGALVATLLRDGETVARASVAHRGKSGGSYLEVVAVGPPGSPVAFRGEDPGAPPIDLAATWWATGGRATARASARGAVTRTGSIPAGALGPARWELVLRAEAPGASVDLVLTRLRLRGLRPAPPSAPPGVARAFLVGDDQGVLASRDPGLRAALLRALTWEARGEAARADGALIGALREASDEEVLAEAPWLLRFGPERLTHTARTALGRRWPALVREAFGGLMRAGDPDPAYFRAFLDVLGPLPDDPSVEEAGLWANLERHRARALRLSGRTGAGLAAAERAVGFAEKADAERAPDHAFGSGVTALRELAIQVAPTDPDRAMALLERALAWSPAPEAVADRLAVSPDLAALRAHPRWPVVLDARRSAWSALRAP